MLEADPTIARAVDRGSDQLIDALVAWGDVDAIAARISEPGSSLPVEAALLPSCVSPNRMRRALIRLGALTVFAAVVVTLLPGLGELRSRFAHARPLWLAVACALEVLSASRTGSVGQLPAVGSPPQLSIVWIAYLIDQLGTWLPVPGGRSRHLASGSWRHRRR